MLPGIHPLLKKAVITALLAAAGYAFIPAKTLWKIGLRVPYRLEWFDVTAPDGSKLSSEECVDRPILVMIWGAWCPYMSQNLGTVNKLTSRLRYTDVCVVSVADDASMEKSWAFAKTNNIERPYYWGNDGLSDMFWDWGGVPRYYFFDRRGYLQSQGILLAQDYDAVVDGVAAALQTGEKSFSPSPTNPERARYLAENSRPDPEKTRIDAESRQLLAVGNLDALDAMATDFRKARARTEDDQWKEDFVVDALAFDPDEPGHRDAEHTARIRLLEDWVAARPASVTARTALAQQWFYYAWFARGQGRAKDVANENMRLFEERIEKSRILFEEVAALPETTHIAYYDLLRISTVQSWDQSKIDVLLQRALALEPDYFPYYFTRANGLLPRWNGSDEELSRFLTASADARKDGRGDELYARLVAHNLWAYADEHPFKAVFSWSRTQAGFRSLLAAHPDSAFWRNRFARAAVAAGDKPVAAEIFAALGERFDQEAWGDRVLYEKSRRWASRRPTMTMDWSNALSGMMKRLHDR